MRSRLPTLQKVVKRLLGLERLCCLATVSSQRCHIQFSTCACPQLRACSSLSEKVRIQHRGKVRNTLFRQPSPALDAKMTTRLFGANQAVSSRVDTVGRLVKLVAMLQTRYGWPVDRSICGRRNRYARLNVLIRVQRVVLQKRTLSAAAADFWQPEGILLSLEALWRTSSAAIVATQLALYASPLNTVARIY